MDTAHIPEQYRNTIWDMQIISPENGAFVFSNENADITQEIDDDRIIHERSGTFMSFTPNTLENMKPLIFPSKIYAELYRQFLLDMNPEHDIQNMTIKFMAQLPTDSGYFLQQRFGTCPKCGKLAQYGDATKDEFFCETCETPFNTSGTQVATETHESEV